MRSTNRRTMSWATRKFRTEVFKEVLLEGTLLPGSAQEKVPQIMKTLHQELSEVEILISGRIL